MKSVENSHQKTYEDILDEFKSLMDEDVAITLDNEIIKDLHRFNLINEKEYKKLIESNQMRS